MRVLRDRASIASTEDPALRALLETRVQALDEFDDCELHELVMFVIVEPFDSLHAVDQQLGFSVLTRPFDLMEEHLGYFEIVFVLSDDGYGLEVFVPKVSGVPDEMLAMCRAHVAQSQERTDT